ncbi:MAG: hypothetical protein IJ411_06530 [Oscillospiraceae bacterium]|nr:hypothetical protein [Oscillospiraceae bacterium]
MLTLRPFAALEKLRDKLRKKMFEDVWTEPETKTPDAAQKTISILLTRFPDNGSRVISLLTRYYYTHASIGLPEDHNTYYSFVRKGFIVEKVTRYVRPNWKPLPCQLYEIPVSEESYDRIKDRLNSFVERKPSLQYSNLGVVLGLCRIRHKMKNQYFCSQFVAEVLKETCPEQLKKDPSVCFPKDLSFLPKNKLVFQGTLPDLVRSFNLSGN